jgi:hypothetical protein
MPLHVYRLQCSGFSSVLNGTLPMLGAPSWSLRMSGEMEVSEKMNSLFRRDE